MLSRNANSNLHIHQKEMKKTLLLTAALVALITSCGPNKSTNPKEGGMAKAGDAKDAPMGKVAYVEVDSLVTQLDMCIEAKAALEAKGKQAEQQLASKQQAFQNAYQAFENKMKTTGYKSQQEYENAQKNLQRMQEEGAKLEQSLGENLAKEQDAFNQRLRDSLQSYIKVLNADGRYSMILSKSGDNVLYADPSLDITEEVIKGMNKRYKKETPKVEMPKTETPAK